MNDLGRRVLNRWHNRAAVVGHSLGRKSTAKQVPDGMGQRPIVAATHGLCMTTNLSENLEESRDKVEVDFAQLWDGTVD